MKLPPGSIPYAEVKRRLKLFPHSEGHKPPTVVTKGKLRRNHHAASAEWQIALASMDCIYFPSGLLREDGAFKGAKRLAIHIASILTMEAP